MEELGTVLLQNREGGNHQCGTLRDMGRKCAGPAWNNSLKCDPGDKGREGGRGWVCLPGSPRQNFLEQFFQLQHSLQQKEWQLRESGSAFISGK